MSQNLNIFKAFDIDPLREHREMMASLSDPLKDLRLDTSFRDPLKEHREMMAAIADPMKELRAMTQSFSDPLKEHREMMAAIADPMKELRVAAYSLPDPLKEHREMMEAITNPMKQLQEAMALVVEPAKWVHKNPSLTILKQMAEAELFDVAMQSSGISKDEVNEISSEILTTSAATEAESLERLLDNILQEVKALKEPKIQQVIATYIFPIIIMILGLLLAPVSDYHIKGYLQSDNRTRNKAINEQVVSSVTDRQQLNTFRFVSTDTLNVRTEASMKSNVLGYFHYGYVVNIVRKEKNWSLVEWVDHESELKISGWVHTRYLKRFK